MLPSDELNEGNLYTVAVAIPRPLLPSFTYELPPHLLGEIQIGKRVKVPFGRSVVQGFVIEEPRCLSLSEGKALPYSLRKVLAVTDSEPLISDEIFKFCQWIHSYYFCSLGESLQAALSFLSNKKARKKTHTITQKLINLNPEQTHAVEFLKTQLNEEVRKPILLEGPTGSGKTEVYLGIARLVLEQGQSVMILLPEIALTTQLHHRFEEGLGMPVGLWHSAVSKGVRSEQFEAVKQGTLRVIVGARSALFAPFPNLGLIVVDEEHDSTYKQDKGHARDLALVRGKMAQALVLLGSASPSLETLERVREGRYLKVNLTQRVEGRPFPEIKVVDLKTESKAKHLQAPLSEYALSELKRVLAENEQALIFLNRRGFAAFLLCKECGNVSECKNCSITLTYYKKNQKLKCHYCGHEERIPEKCIKCEGLSLFPMGAGTESLEAELPALLPNARIARLDRDEITSSTRLEKILTDFKDKNTDILLGTQMLVKGHDFPGVTLVVVIMADALFHWPDFRACERAYQVLKQVAGRAGRGEKPGKVIIQTYDPNHPILEVMKDPKKEASFLSQERELREALAYPPFGRLARLRLEGRDAEESFEEAKALVHFLGEVFSQEITIGKLQFLGPAEAFIKKVKTHHRWDILIKATQIDLLHLAVKQSQQKTCQSKNKLIIDIDPYHF